MRLILKIRSYCDQQPSDSKSRTFNTFPIIIGRSSSCDYCLQDASRYISANHAVITHENGQIKIEDTSSNGVYVNGATEPVGRGHSVTLKPADSLTIGDYTLSVDISESSENAPNALTDDSFAGFPEPAGMQPGEPESSGFDPFRGAEPDWTPPSAQQDDPFGDDWGLDDHSDAARESSRAPRESDWADWIDGPEAKPSSQSTAGDAGKSRIDSHEKGTTDEFDWLPGTSSETVSIPPSIPAGNSPRYPSAPPGSAPPGPSAPGSARRQTPGQAPRHAMGQALGRPAPDPLQHAGTQPHSVRRLLQAADLREADFATYSEADVLEQAGKVLALSVDAIMALLQSRAEIKNAIRSDVTTLGRSENNPLKFSYSAADALTKLLSDHTEGYMNADTAIHEAVDDLKLHQLAMLEGMKAFPKLKCTQP